MSVEEMNKDLYFAAENGKVDEVQSLLKKRADVNYHNPHWVNQTALMVSTRYGHIGVARLLLDYKADVNAKNKYVKTAAHCARQFNHTEIVAMLETEPARRLQEEKEKAAKEEKEKAEKEAKEKVFNMDNIARMTNTEMKGLIDVLETDIKRGERLAYHFTSKEMVGIIMAPGSHGLRASKVGQLGGGLSLCKLPPHELGWDKYGGPQWRSTIGKALWGEKAEDVRLGNKDAKKLEAMFVIKIDELYFNDNRRVLPGREAVLIIPTKFLTAHGSDHYLSKDHIVKVYDLSSDKEQAGVAGAMAEGAASSAAGGMLDQVKKIKETLHITAHSPKEALKEANEQMGLESSGPLPAQAAALIAALRL